MLPGGTTHPSGNPSSATSSFQASDLVPSLLTVLHLVRRNQSSLQEVCSFYSPLSHSTPPDSLIFLFNFFLYQHPPVLAPDCLHLYHTFEKRCMITHPVFTFQSQNKHQIRFSSRINHVRSTRPKRTPPYRHNRPNSIWHPQLPNWSQ